MSISPGGIVYINESAANTSYMTTGLTINQGAADNEALALQSSDVTHALTDYVADGTYFSIRKATALGGAQIRVIAKDFNSGGQVLTVIAAGGQADIGKGTGNRGLINFEVLEHDGDNGETDIAGEGNVFGVVAKRGGSPVSVFMVDEDGDLFAGNATVTVITDEYEDAFIARAFDHQRAELGAKGMVLSKWDEFVDEYRPLLFELGILGSGPETKGDPMWNVTQHVRVLNSAVWQGYTRQMGMQERIDTLETKLLAIEGGK
jgi:hypothetical protein